MTALALLAVTTAMSANPDLRPSCWGHGPPVQRIHFQGVRFALSSVNRLFPGVQDDVTTADVVRRLDSLRIAHRPHNWSIPDTEASGVSGTLGTARSLGKGEAMVIFMEGWAGAGEVIAIEPGRFDFAGQKAGRCQADGE